MRITSELIEEADKYSNCLKEFTLDLRGRNIAVIENMGLAATHNYDCIDLMDNDLQAVTGFPVLSRLDHLQLGNNRITFIDPKIGQMMPRLMDFTAQNNRMAELGDLAPLGGLRNLEHLTLHNNPVTSKENYKYFVIWLCPSVRFIDYQRVTQAERETAQQLYGTKDAPTDLAKSLVAQKSNEFDIPLSLGDGDSAASVAVKINRMNLKPEEQKRLHRIIANASSIEEVERLEKELNEGRLPPGVIEKQ